MNNKFRLKEIDLVIYFPSTGNQGRPIKKYGVAYRSRMNNESQAGRRINLEDVLELPEIKNGYPHIMGLFRNSSGKGKGWLPEYVENRLIRTEDEFLTWVAEVE